MSQLDIQTDTEGRIIGLSGNFTKQTNSNGEEDHFAPDAVTITVPENMEAHVSASMTVDDWGYIDITPISGAGSTIRAVNLTTEVANPGPRGGHVRWSGQTTEAIVLQPGQYNITVRQDNAPYNEAYASKAEANVSFCQASVTIEYVAILAPIKMNPLTQSDANELMKDYNVYNYTNMPDHKQVWEAIGGTAKEGNDSTSPTCAARVSQALCDYGVSLPPEPDLERNGFLNYKNKNGKVVYVRAVSIHNFMENQLGNPTFTSASAFRSHLSNNNATAVIIWSLEKNGRIAHVGMGYQNEGCAKEGTFDEATSIWVLNSSAFAEPTESQAPFTR